MLGIIKQILFLLMLVLSVFACSDDLTEGGANSGGGIKDTDSSVTDDTGNSVDSEQQDTDVSVDTGEEDTGPADSESADSDPADSETSADTGDNVLFVEAECAFGLTTGDCNGISGSNSETDPAWGDEPSWPALEMDDTIVAYMTGNMGIWIKYDNLDLTGFTSIRASVAGNIDGGGFIVKTGSADASGTQIAYISIGDTSPGEDDWQTFVTVTADFDKPVSGTHDVYIVPDPALDGEGNGNLDWFEFN